MSFVSRFLGIRKDPREALRPLWHGLVGVSREEEWYADCGVADTVEGRFDMITLVLSLVLLRMEKSETLAPQTGLLTELFVEDMDRQLRDSGVGDLMVGKNMGKLMSALGGRLGALRENLGESDAQLATILARNISLADEEKRPFALAVRSRALHNDLAALDDATLLTGTLRP
ncbi:ubiquinol-cytochrome C chaperone family protein [Aurantiacibacter poecillastricola]|uniref:ubiquinol-cytochrome C chaperone family protein n=1 Tax=Aurantiacibacter poecillastricola TaxID=3064385 RepID=UPI00273F3389|nr:ubiquinol-cytochrome C chaperone family protein [Aurantiacibacter sp. 219JJ12-13]MDP5263181.1 ubiquinol-cytochrome C chaperone family protein [Aurantiacibacter sp. 219JJ12-13]